MNKDFFKGMLAATVIVSATAFAVGDYSRGIANYEGEVEFVCHDYRGFTKDKYGATKRIMVPEGIEASVIDRALVCSNN